LVILQLWDCDEFVPDKPNEKCACGASSGFKSMLKLPLCSAEQTCDKTNGKPTCVKKEQGNSGATELGN